MRSVRCECCNRVTASADGQPVICVTCVMELERCGPVDLAAGGLAA